MKNETVVQVTVWVFVAGQFQPGTTGPEGFVKPDGTVSVTVVCAGEVALHAGPVFVTVMVKVTVCPACAVLGVAVLVIDRLQEGGPIVMIAQL